MFLITMRNFKGLIMSEYTSKLTILRHFLKMFSMIHMPSKPIASAGCDITLFLCKKLTLQIRIYTQTRVSCSIFQNFLEEIYMPLNPKQLTTGLHYHYFVSNEQY